MKKLAFNEKNMQRIEHFIHLPFFHSLSFGTSEALGGGDGDGWRAGGKTQRKKSKRREKVFEFKLKRLTTLNYNTLQRRRKKARLLQCISKYRVRRFFFFHLWCLKKKCTKKQQQHQQQQRQALSECQIEHLSIVYIYTSFGTCQHFHN